MGKLHVRVNLEYTAEFPEDTSEGTAMIRRMANEHINMLHGFTPHIEIEESSVRIHKPYDHGMPMLSPAADMAMKAGQALRDQG